MNKFTLINTTKTTLGPAALIQYLHSRNLYVNYIYAPKHNDDLYTKEDLELLNNEVKSSDIIGLSCFFISEKRTLQLAKYIKSLYPEKHIILGGPNVIMEPKRLLEKEGIDSVCIHEGELPLENLIINYKKGTNDIKGIWFKTRNEI